MSIKVIGKMLFKLLVGIITSISIVSIATVIVLNSTFMYKIMINKYNLVEETGVSAENLMKNYNGLVKYLQNPFIEKLRFYDFTMSYAGEIHFMEVKHIFINLIYISIIFILGMIIYFFLQKLTKNKETIKSLINNFNLSANILITFFIVLGILFSIDFSKVFIIFHKIFFRNDYWIFDSATDPIINALPQEVFMIYAITILAILAVFSIIIKIVHIGYNSKKLYRIK